MEARGTALLTDEIPAQRALTTTISREEIAGVLQDPEATPELFLDLVYGEEQSTVGISWSYGELESLFERTSGDQITLTFDRDELQSLFDDVEAHGLRERALVFTVAAVGALGSGAAIANAAVPIEQGSSGASVAMVETMATNSAGGVMSNVHTPGLQTGDEAATASAPAVESGAAMAAAASIKLAAEPQPAVSGGVASNVHTPGLQLGPEESTAAASAVHSSTAAQTAAADSGVMSNVHTPGLQIGPEESAAAAASVKLSTEPHPAVVDSGVMSNVHTPGLQIGPEESTAATRSVQVSAGSGDGEFLGIDTRDATEALIAGGILLAIAGATFAGARRPGSARPA